LDPLFFVICGFITCLIAICGPKLFCGLKTSASPQIHTNIANIAYNAALLQICIKKQIVLKIRVLGLFDCFETELSSIL
jgi:hypothetical protein